MESARPHSRFSAINGLQIVGDSTPVPEPASLALLALGSMAMLARRRQG